MLLLTETKNYFIMLLQIETNNKMNNIKEIAKAINSIHTEEDICSFFKELLTETEINTLSKRWCILKMLSNGKTQREIANDLNVSLCKVTRGAKILKDKKAITPKLIQIDKGD